MEENIYGFLLVNKAKNISSYDCIRHIKKILNKKEKIGHAGTLDNFASGLLIIGIGRQATKHISQLTNLDKEYIVEAKLGELTDTLDHTGKIIEQQNCPNITAINLQQAINALGKSYIQTPPVYSALKHKGKPLYQLARTNKVATEKLDEIVKQKSREIKIFNLEILDFSPPFFQLRAHVSKGTYVRSLANDIAQKLNTYATTYQLQRTKIGDISLDQAIDVYKLKSIEDIENNLMSPEQLTNILF